MRCIFLGRVEGLGLGLVLPDCQHTKPMIFALTVRFSISEISSTGLLLSYSKTPTLRKIPY